MADGHYEQINSVGNCVTNDNSYRSFERQIDSSKNSRELAEVEWDAIATVVPGFENGLSCVGCIPKRCELITFNEALQFFQTASMQLYSTIINPTLEYRGFAFVMHCLCGPPRLCSDLTDERNLVFAMAACPLDNSKDVHIRVLQTIYRKLTGHPFDCPRYGNHWELIGFQGSDPATDLRGAGFWGLMNVLYFLMNPETFPLAHSIYVLSLHETQHFPFVVMSINVTAIVLQVLREERLNKICNGRKQVIGVVNDFYVAVFLHLYQRWKNEHKTIVHSGFILKDVDAYAKRNPKALIKAMQQYCKNLSNENQPGRCATSRAPVPAKTATCIPEFSLLPEMSSGYETECRDQCSSVSRSSTFPTLIGEAELYDNVHYEQNTPETAHVVMSNGTVIAAKVYEDGEELFI